MQGFCKIREKKIIGETFLEIKLAVDYIAKEKNTLGGLRSLKEWKNVCNQVFQMLNADTAFYVLQIDLTFSAPKQMFQKASTNTHPHIIVYLELGEGKSHTLDPSHMLTLDISINRSGAIQSLLCFKSM